MFNRIKQIIVVLGDLAALYLGLYTGVILRRLGNPGDEFFKLLSPITPLFLLLIVILFIIGFYDLSRARNTVKFFQKIALSAGIWFMLSVLYFYTNPTTTVTPKTTLLLITLCGFSFLSLWRAFYNSFLSANFLKTPIVFVGWNNEIAEIVRDILKFPEHGYSVAGVVNSSPIPVPLPSAPILKELVKINNGIYPGIIVIAEAYAEDNTVLSELYQALYQQVGIVPLADFYENFFKRIPSFTFSEIWFISNLKEQTRKMYDRFHILLDLIIALIMGVVFAITLPFIAIAIKLTSPGPIFFKQVRIGRLGLPFTIYKLRTMKALNDEGSAETDGPEFAKVNDSRVTSVGKFLRRTRLDELPQFINILRGEMAIIGPRPERPEFVEELTKNMPFYSLRHLVKPGISGWAQLQHSYYGTIEENLLKLQYDLYYIKNRGLVLDAVIMLRTINVLARFMGR